MSNAHEGITVFAPARVDLSPGFTDVGPFCRDEPGRIANVALDLGVEVTVGDDIASPQVSAFVDRLCGKVAERLGIDVPGIRLSASVLPAGSGLGSSGALSVAIAYALSIYAGSSTDPAFIVDLACDSERDAGLTGGTQDQLASMYGGAGLVRRLGDVSRRTSIDADLGELGARLVLVYGNGTRNSGSIIESVLYDRPRDAVLSIISSMNRVGDETARSLAHGDVGALAELMNETTSLLRALHPEIVGVDFAERLRSFGALAGKPCGAGGPGAVWAVLVDAAHRQNFVDAAVAAGWSVLPAVPSAVGATVVRHD